MPSRSAVPESSRTEMWPGGGSREEVVPPVPDEGWPGTWAEEEPVPVYDVYGTSKHHSQNGRSRIVRIEDAVGWWDRSCQQEWDPRVGVWPEGRHVKG